MKESVSYQAIIEEGRIEGRSEGQAVEARRLLLRLGKHHYKADPNAEEQAALDAITHVERLEDLALIVTEHSSWATLLGLTPPAGKGNRRNKS